MITLRNVNVCKLRPRLIVRKNKTPKKITVLYVCLATGRSFIKIGHNLLGARLVTEARKYSVILRTLC